MTTITPLELQKSIAVKDNFLLIDVREDFEHEHFNIGGILMPIGTVIQNIDHIPTDKPVIFFCEKGIRSVIIIQRLEDTYGFKNLINLAGGMRVKKKEAIQ